MALFTWSETFAVGIQEMDQQHQHMVEIMNRLHTALAHARAQHELQDIFSALLTHAASHFAAEERLMDLHHYPQAQTHKLAHQALTQQLKLLHARMREDPTLLSMELMDFLRCWLDDHIQQMDSALGEHLQRVGVR